MKPKTSRIEQLTAELSMLNEPVADGDELIRQFIIWERAIRACEIWFMKHGSVMVKGGLFQAIDVNLVLVTLGLVMDKKDRDKNDEKKKSSDRSKGRAGSDDR